MRILFILCAAAAVLLAGSTAIAEAPEPPRGNFGGGALVAPPKDIFGPGNAIIGLRALPGRELEIEATVRARCTGGDIATRTKIAADGSFSADGTETQEPRPGDKVKVTYELSGSFTGERAVEGRLSATLTESSDGASESCKTGSVTFHARRPNGDIGERGAPRRARYFGNTEQRGVGPRRPIVLRVSGDGKRISYALFGHQVRCSDNTRSIGIEAPRTNLKIGEGGKVTDRDRDEIDNGATRTNVDDRFTATVGREGAKGTLSLSDRTIDKATGNVIQSCKSGKVDWVAAL